MPTRYRPLRWPCRFDLTVERADGPRRAVLLNVTRVGALVAGLGPVRAGEELVLCLPAGRRAAVVRWARADRCGVAFGAPLAPGELDVVRGRAGRGTPRLGPLGARELR